MAIEATGVDRKEQEIRVKTAVNSSPCLIMDYNTGRYKRVSLNETNEPPDNSTATYRRFCYYCNTDIAVIDWPEHIKTQSHLVRLYLLKHQICFCWTGNINIPIHDPNTCDECKKRYTDEKKKDNFFLTL